MDVSQMKINVLPGSSPPLGRLAMETRKRNARAKLFSFLPRFFAAHSRSVRSHESISLVRFFFYLRFVTYALSRSFSPIIEWFIININLFLVWCPDGAWNFSSRYFVFLFFHLHSFRQREKPQVGKFFGGGRNKHFHSHLLPSTRTFSAGEFSIFIILMCF